VEKFLIKNMKIKTILNNKKGFGLVEMLMSMTILAIALVALMTLMTHLIRAAKINENKVVALNLAREGVEIVRNIRDTNWLTACPTWGGTCSHWTTAGGTRSCCLWDSGLDSDTDHTLVLDFDPATDRYILNYLPDSISSADAILYYDPINYLYLTDTYADTVSADSGFARLITIDYICRDNDGTNEQIISSGGCGTQKKVGVQVTSTVQWNDGDVELVDKLYNWK